MNLNSNPIRGQPKKMNFQTFLHVFLFKNKSLETFIELQQTYLSRHERLGNNSAERDNNMTKSVAMENKDQNPTHRFFVFLILFVCFIQYYLRFEKIKKKKPRITQLHGDHHHEPLVRPNPLDLCYLLHRPDQCSLKPSTQTKRTRLNEKNTRKF